MQTPNHKNLTNINTHHWEIPISHPPNKSWKLLLLQMLKRKWNKSISFTSGRSVKSNLFVKQIGIVNHCRKYVCSINEQLHSYECIIGQCFSYFINYLGILFKLRFKLINSGWILRWHISTNCPSDADTSTQITHWVARPLTK